MAIYKFRVSFEDYEDISRDIEIRSSQTFFDFFQIILQSIDFDTKQAASFFTSDDYWSKHKEITLLKEDVEPGVKLMKDTKIASFIEQPNQRFVFIYDKEACWSLLIELIKLVPENAKANYPHCTKSNGIAPVQYKKKLIEEVKEEEIKEEVENGGRKPKKPSSKDPLITREENIVFVENEESSLFEDEAGIVEKGEDDEFEERGEEDEIDAESEEPEGDEKW
ncbi:MAG: IS1096 element passenger TnpR family protein [Bacteroidia bacterium]